MFKPLRLDIASLQDNSPSVIDAALVKKHVRIDFDDEDDLLERYILAGVHWCEAVLHRTLFRREHVWILENFEYEYPPYRMRLPRGKTNAVTSVAYSSGGSLVTLTGPSSTIPGSDYQEDLRGDDGGVIMPARGSSWPSVDSDVPAPVAVTFNAGWAADELPADLLHGVLFTIADCYDMRSINDFNPAMLNAGGARFEARWALISPYLLSRWY